MNELYDFVYVSVNKFQIIVIAPKTFLPEMLQLKLEHKCHSWIPFISQKLGNI